MNEGKRIVEMANGLQVGIEEKGSGAPVLLLNGGAGPMSMAGLAAALSPSFHVVTVTHPGFDRTPRPAWCDSIPDLALAYADSWSWSGSRTCSSSGNRLVAGSQRKWRRATRHVCAASS